MLIAKIKQLAKSSPILFISGLLLSATVIIPTTTNTIESGEKIINYFNQIFRYKKPYYEKVARLSTDITIDYFISILGEPIIMRDAPHEFSSKPQYKYEKQYIFVNEYFFTQAITSESHVMMYSVTARRKGFNPDFKGVVIGKTKPEELFQKWGKPDLQETYPDYYFDYEDF